MVDFQDYNDVNQPVTAPATKADQQPRESKTPRGRAKSRDRKMIENGYKSSKRRGARRGDSINK